MPFIECCSHLVLMSNNDFLLLLNKLIATTTEKWIILLLCGLERATVCYKLSDWKTGKKLYLDLNKLSTCDVLA